MKNTYEVRAKKFIQQLYPFIADCKTYYQFSQAIQAFNHIYNRNVQMAYGLTRIAFITSDYVVKIDYTKSNFNFERFGDCEREMAMYEIAKEDGFEYLFAKITDYCYRQHNFYIMPRIHGIGRTDWDADMYVTPEERDWLYEHVKDLHNGNYGWKNGRIVIIDYACSV